MLVFSYYRSVQIPFIIQKQINQKFVSREIAELADKKVTEDWAIV